MIHVNIEGLGFVLFLAGWLGITIALRHRAEKRRASGWQQVEVKSAWVSRLQNLAGLLFAAALGGYLNQSYGVAGGWWWLAGFIVLCITPTKKWISPKHSPIQLASTLEKS